MRIVIFGATGSTGRLVVDQALKRGHEVTAVVRDRGRFKRDHERLTVVEGQVLDPVSVDAIVPGHEAVLSALGPRSPRVGTIYSESGRNILAAMRRHGVTRFVCITSGAVEEDDPSFGVVFKRVIRPTIVRGIVFDCLRLEALLRENDWAEWTAVRPGTLTDEPGTGSYRVAARFMPSEKKDPTVPRADVAHLMLEVLESDEWVRATPTICT